MLHYTLPGKSNFASKYRRLGKLAIGIHIAQFENENYPVKSMKKAHIAPYCVLLAGLNCFTPWILGQMGQIIMEFFGGRLGGLNVIAGCTRIAFALPPWFYVFTALSILPCIGLFSRKVSAALLIHWLLAVLILECAVLVFFAVGMCISFMAPLEKVGG